MTIASTAMPTYKRRGVVVRVIAAAVVAMTGRLLRGGGRVHVERRPSKHLAAVGQVHGTRVSDALLILRQEAIDRDDVAGAQRVARPALPHQAIRRAELEVPIDDLAV